LPRTSGFFLVGLLVASALCVVGCGGSRERAGPPNGAPARPGVDRWGTTWLCRPGLAHNPCVADLTTTVVAPSGAQHVVRASPTDNPSADCFYVYPTVSDQRAVNASLDAGLREQLVAIAQASRFSKVCNVYAPVYRQITLSALSDPRRITLHDAAIAYDDVRAAFHDYLAHYNHGRGIVFIGHSQGAAILIRLLRKDVDGRRGVRARLVSALLLGGNVTVRKGHEVGGDFVHIPACSSSHEFGCVVAYSSFGSEPPPNSQFGRTTSDAGVHLLAPRKPSPRLQIMCVNPASPAGGTAYLDPAIPSIALTFLATRRPLAIKTPWVSFPHEYTGRCESSGNATWLQVSRPRLRGDRRPPLTGLQQPILGLHILDVNIALGDLVRLVRNQAAAYGHR
jgi:hypothetical protein